jgi:hypothetical protein
VTRAYVDAGFKDDVMIHGAVHGIIVEQVKRNDSRPGFVPVAHRWVVERTHGTLMLHRRLTREYESLPASSVSHTLWSSTAHLTRRLTGTTTPTWRTGDKDMRVATRDHQRHRGPRLGQIRWSHLVNAQLEDHQLMRTRS